MSKEPVSPVTITDWRGATVLPYATWTQIRSLQHQGQSIRQIARGLDLSRNTVRQALRSPTPPQYGPRAPRPSLVGLRKVVWVNNERGWESPRLPTAPSHSVRLRQPSRARPSAR